jgi:integrase/recombinase XerD
MRNQTLSNHYQSLTQFGVWCKKPFTELSEDDLLDYDEFLSKYTFIFKGKPKKYSEGTKYTKFATVKAFLRELKIDAVTAITAKPQSMKKLPEDLLTKEEIEALINNCHNTRDRTIIAVLYESGMRRGELFSIKIKNIQFDENGVIITIPDGKTGARRIRLVFAASFLREWLDVHPTKNNRDSPVFCSSRKPYNVMTEYALRHHLKGIAKRAGIHKRVNPHSFRHARATHLAEHLTEQQLKNYLGWTPGSNVAQIYVHLSGKDIDNAILKMNGIQIDNTHADGLKVGRCPRCKELNPEVSLYCSKCGLPLTEELKTKIDKVAAELELSVIQAAIMEPAILKEIEKWLNKRSD